MKVCASLLASLTVAGASEASGTPELIPIGELHEHLSNSVKVAGMTLVGLRRGQAKGPLSIDQLAAELPKGSSDMLCLDATTRDGRYTAEQDFRLSKPAGGPASLGLHGQHVADLRQYASGDLAVKLQLRQSCDGGPVEAIVAARWNGQPNDDRLVVDVNLKVSQAAIELRDGGDAGAHSLATGDCAALESGAATAYDHECSLELTSAVAAKARILRLKIRGASGSRRDEDYPVILSP